MGGSIIPISDNGRGDSPLLLSLSLQVLNYAREAACCLVCSVQQVLALVRRLHEVPFNHGALRVSTSIKIDDRRDKAGSIKQKMKSVEEKL